MLLSNDKIHSIYTSSHCVCSAAKWENSAFCDGCYNDLSIRTKIKLTRKFREGFEVAFRIACAELDGSEPPPDKTDERLLSIWKSIAQNLKAGEFDRSEYDSANPVQDLAEIIKKEYDEDIRNSEIAKLMCLMFPGSDAELLEQELSQDDFGC